MKELFILFLLVCFSLYLSAEGIHHLQKRVIGGQEYNEGKWPWLVSIQGKIPTKKLFGIPIKHKKIYCGASLINEQWLMTAAHCFTENSLGSDVLVPRYWHAKLGDVDLKNTAKDKVKGFFAKLLDIEKWKNWYFHAQKIIIHPNYDSDNLWSHDIALIKLEESVPSGPDDVMNIQSVSLINQGNMSFPFDGQECMMKGWGCTNNGGPASERAREVKVIKTPDLHCVEFWGLVISEKLCAGSSFETNVGICSGDSGGPLVCHNGDRWIQVGVASFTSASRPELVPAVFTRVSAHRDWIDSVIREDEQESRVNYFRILRRLIS